MFGIRNGLAPDVRLWRRGDTTQRLVPSNPAGQASSGREQRAGYARRRCIRTTADVGSIPTVSTGSPGTENPGHACTIRSFAAGSCRQARHRLQGVSGARRRSSCRRVADQRFRPVADQSQHVWCPGSGHARFRDDCESASSRGRDARVSSQTGALARKWRRSHLRVSASRVPIGGRSPRCSITARGAMLAAISGYWTGRF